MGKPSRRPGGCTGGSSRVYGATQYAISRIIDRSWSRMAAMTIFISLFIALSPSPTHRRHPAHFIASQQEGRRFVTCAQLRTANRETSMQEPLPHGSLIRKVWIAEAERYRE